MKYLKSYLFAFLCVLTGAFINAADAPKTPPTASAPAVAVEKLEDVQKERDALKAKVAELEEAVKQLNAGAALLQTQRNDALDAAVQRAMAAATTKK